MWQSETCLNDNFVFNNQYGQFWFWKMSYLISKHSQPWNNSNLCLQGDAFAGIRNLWVLFHCCLSISWKAEIKDINQGYQARNKKDLFLLWGLKIMFYLLSDDFPSGCHTVLLVLFWLIFLYCILAFVLHQPYCTYISAQSKPCTTATVEIKKHWLNYIL